MDAALLPPTRARRRKPARPPRSSAPSLPAAAQGHGAGAFGLHGLPDDGSVLQAQASLHLRAGRVLLANEHRYGCRHSQRHACGACMLPAMKTAQARWHGDAWGAAERPLRAAAPLCARSLRTSSTTASRWAPGSWTPPTTSCCACCRCWRSWPPRPTCARSSPRAPRCTGWCMPRSLHGRRPSRAWPPPPPRRSLEGVRLLRGVQQAGRSRTARQRMRPQGPAVPARPPRGRARRRLPQALLQTARAHARLYGSGRCLKRGGLLAWRGAAAAWGHI